MPPWLMAPSASVSRWHRDRRLAKLRRLADEARDRNDFEAAARLYRDVLAVDESLTEIQVQCGHMNKEVGRFEEAGECYLRALSAAPGDPDIHLQMGHLHKVAGRLRDAAWAYYRASEFAPGWAEALGELCAIYEKVGAEIVPLLSVRWSQRLFDDCKISQKPGFMNLTGWATVGGSPRIQVRYPDVRIVKIELFRLAELRSKESLPAPSISVCADASIDSHTAQVSGLIEDGPYIVLARSAEDEQPLGLTAIVVDSMSRFRLSYQAVVEEEQAQLELDRVDMEAFTREMLLTPRFIVYCDASRASGHARSRVSLESQIYAHWVFIPFDGRLTAEMLGSHGGDDFVVWLEEGDELRPNALFEFATAINAWPETDIHYGDEDVRLPDGQLGSPFYKPDWSPDYLEVFNYIGRPACFRVSTARQTGPSKGYYDFVLRFTETTDRIRHIRRVLCSAAISPAVSRDRDDQRRALSGRLDRTKRVGALAPLADAGFGWDLQISLSMQPLVSIVLPTAGKTVQIDGKTIDLLPNVLNSIFSKSTYRNIEVVIVHNGDLSAVQRADAASFGGRLVHYGEPRFNISKKLNLGVKEARGEIVILLNDDIEVLNAAWIERMLEHFEKGHVGVVGARLLYSDHTIQHAGVVINRGNPDHVVRGMPASHAGYFLSTCGVHNFSAVTGACLMVRRGDYLSVGGFSEDLPISYNDIDFCHKIRLKGLSVVYAPQATLIHMESQSRTPALDEEEAATYRRTWATQDAVDPFYNEIGLSICPPTFDVTFNGRYV
ncbi:MAG: glycosyltransferase [Planctomycetota bacterium]